MTKALVLLWQHLINLGSQVGGRWISKGQSARGVFMFSGQSQELETNASQIQTEKRTRQNEGRFHSAFLHILWAAAPAPMRLVVLAPTLAGQLARNVSSKKDSCCDGLRPRLVLAARLGTQAASCTNKRVSASGLDAPKRINAP